MRVLRRGMTGISIHAPREGGDIADMINNTLTEDISIHAPREGGDCGTAERIDHVIISIHAPREGGDFVEVVQ